MNQTKRKIFILEDIAADAELMIDELQQSGMPFEFRRGEPNINTIIREIKDFGPDVILSDYSMPGFNGLHVFKLLQEEQVDIPFILVTGELSEDIVIEFLKEGIDEYVMKSNMKRLPHAVDAVLKKREIRKEKDQALEDLKQNEIALKHHAKQLDFLLSRSRILNSILEATSDFVGIAGTDFKCQYINKAGRKLLGISDDADTSNMKIKELQPGWAIRYLDDEGIPYAIKHGSWHGETALMTVDKKEIPISQVIIAHKNDKGEVEYFSTIARELKAPSGTAEGDAPDAKEKE